MEHVLVVMVLLGPLGSSSGALGVLLELLKMFFEDSAASWALLGPVRAMLGHLGALVELYWDVLGFSSHKKSFGSWYTLGASLSVLGRCESELGAHRLLLDAFWRAPGRLLGALGELLSCSQSLLEPLGVTWGALRALSVPWRCSWEPLGALLMPLGALLGFLDALVGLRKTKGN